MTDEALTAPPVDKLRSAVELTAFALTVWREARGEGASGMKAVACSIRNRVRRPTWWGKSFYEVVTKKWQYSAMTATGDPQLSTWPRPDDPQFDQALWICSEVMADRLDSPVPGADSYFDLSIQAPSWATPDKFVGQVGRMRFFNMDRDIEARRQLA